MRLTLRNRPRPCSVRRDLSLGRRAAGAGGWAAPPRGQERKGNIRANRNPWTRLTLLALLTLAAVTLVMGVRANSCKAIVYNVAGVYSGIVCKQDTCANPCTIGSGAGTPDTI